MESGLGVGEQFAGLLNALRRCDPSNVSTCLNGEVSLVSLVWPLLPLLPPPPLPVLSELLREPATTNTTEDKCDMCGKTGKNFVTRSRPTPKGSSGAELRQVGQKRSSLDRMMDVIEHKIEEALKNIEQTTVRSNELNRQTKDLSESIKPAMTDKELLDRLKSLVKEKETIEQRVKVLQTQEQQMKESLITAFEMVKRIPKRQNIPDGRDLTKANLKEDPSQHNPPQNTIIDREDIPFNPSKTNETNVNKQDFTKDIENEDVSRDRETILEEQVTEVSIEQQGLLEQGSSEINLCADCLCRCDSEGEVIVINHI